MSMSGIDFDLQIQIRRDSIKECEEMIKYYKSAEAKKEFPQSRLDYLTNQRKGQIADHNESIRNYKSMKRRGI